MHFQSHPTTDEHPENLHNNMELPLRQVVRMRFRHPRGVRFAAFQFSCSGLPNFSPRFRCGFSRDAVADLNAQKEFARGYLTGLGELDEGPRLEEQLEEFLFEMHRWAYPGGMILRAVECVGLECVGLESRLWTCKCTKVAP